MGRRIFVKDVSMDSPAQIYWWNTKKCAIISLHKWLKQWTKKSSSPVGLKLNQPYSVSMEILSVYSKKKKALKKMAKLRKYKSTPPAGSFAWVLLSDHPDVESRTKLYRPTPTPDMSLEEVGERVVDELITSIQALEEELKPFQAEIKPVDLTEEQEAEFQAATHCYMCEQPFTAASYEMEPADGIPEEAEKKLRVRKVRDHNHATGEYRGAAHASCNINKKQLKHIPVFFFS